MKLDNPTTQFNSVSAPARALTVEYQNTRSTPILVSLSLAMIRVAPDDADIIVYIGAASPAATGVARAGTANPNESMRENLSFIVPPGYFYRTGAITGTVNLVYWIEWV